MIDIKRKISLNWKAILTLVISLFVFTAFNFEANSDIKDAVHTELCLTEDFFEADLTFNPNKAAQLDITIHSSFEYFSGNTDNKKFDEYSNLIVANQLISYNSYKSNIDSNRSYPKSHLIPSSEDESIV